MTSASKNSICNVKNILIFILSLLQISFFISENKLSNAISQLMPLTPVGQERSNQSNGSEKYLSATRIIPKNQKHKSPNWMLAVDCSSYDASCVSYHVASQRYAPYPFRFQGANLSDFVEISQNKKPSWLLNGNVPLHLRHSLSDKQRYTLNKYPDPVSKTEFQKCVDDGLNIPYEEQLDKMLNSLEDAKESGVLFTISDYQYAYDMIHPFFQMSWEYLTYGADTMFMVALDEKTLREACRYDYSVILMPSANKNEDEKIIVQNTKFLVSRDIAERGYNFVFSEMDVWWIQDPMNALRNQGDFDIAVSGHQDNPNALNIGFYAVRSNKRTKEFFQELYKLLEYQPAVFDQFAFNELWRISEPWNDEEGNFTNAERWGGTPPSIPKLKHKLKNQVVLGNYFAAQEWPNIHENTLAVHVLSGEPLSTPNGKKMIAKELGAWYGFHSEPNSSSKAGYYERTGNQNRRYLMLDGYSWMSLDMQDGIIYHIDEALRMIIAFLIVVARQTERILILPKVFHDRAGAFLWMSLDLKSIEEIVEFRETNFINNPKAWFKDSQPFESVARTALGISRDNPEEVKLFAQPKEREDVKAWRFSRNPEEFHLHFVDIWFKLMTSKGLDDAELLLVNPHFFHERRNDFYAYNKTPSPLLNEFWKLHSETIKWCLDGEHNGIQGKLLQIWPVGRTTAGDDCYGKGISFNEKE
mmetsp:Transcript_25147/g.37164  ORF Transcript_25147/g.37164 Transcript_25147/m.37164 type:complete len:698 (-) Transcript_25147:23-2116(-)